MNSIITKNNIGMLEEERRKMEMTTKKNKVNNNLRREAIKFVGQNEQIKLPSQSNRKTAKNKIFLGYVISLL